jgi:hypothetical protein
MTFPRISRLGSDEEKKKHTLAEGELISSGRVSMINNPAR